MSSLNGNTRRSKLYAIAKTLNYEGRMPTEAKLLEFINNVKPYLISFLFFPVLSNGGNDSMAYKTSYYDFRGEKGRDKTLDISPKRFNTTNFMTTKERVEFAEKTAKDGLFQERNHHGEELLN